MNRNKISILLSSSIIIYGIIHQFFIVNNYLNYSELLSSLFILLTTFISIFIFGYRNKKSKDSLTIFFKTLLMVLLFLSVTYAFGLVLGFKRNSYSLNPIIMLKNIFTPILIIICIEIIRFVTYCSINNKKIRALLTFALIIFEISICFKTSSITSMLLAFKLLTKKIAPIVTKNIVLSLIIDSGGLKTTLMYRLILDIYIYIMPIIPDFNDYISSIIGICFPLVLYIYLLSDININYKTINKKSFLPSATDIPIIIIVLIIICLTSNKFYISAIGIGSNSMYPYIERGDAVVYRKIKQKDIKKGKILVYKNYYNNKIIVHRIVKIKKDKNNKIYYLTKGDANDKKDKIKIRYKDIKGVVIFKIKYVARPSLYLEKILKGR